MTRPRKNEQNFSNLTKEFEKEYRISTKYTVYKFQQRKRERERGVKENEAEWKNYKEARDRSRLPKPLNAGHERDPPLLQLARLFRGIIRRTSHCRARIPSRIL